MAAHWAADYIGLPWASPGADCWAFFRRVQAEHFGRALPAVEVPGRHRAWAQALESNPERGNWLPVAEPVEGDGVLMAHARHPSHVGVWLAADGGGVLHCIEGAGVVFSSLPALRAAGWGRIEFYRRVATA